MTDPREGAVTGFRTFMLREPPSANRWWRKWRGRMVKSKAARDYQDYVAINLTMERVEKIAAPTPVSLTFHWHRSRKSGDLDKRLGVLLDALQGLLYDNDAQIVEILARRFDTFGGGLTGHVIIRVEAVP